MASNVILVTGPSGSGKTRLIEKLAMEVPMSSAVLYVCHRFMQEFGTTPPLASSLAARIAPGGYASVFDFGSGCACCSPRGDFQRAVEEVLASASPSNMGPDQTTPPVMFVETTGLADPSVFLSVLADPSLGLKVACVVAIADACNARVLLHEPAPANLSNHLAQQVKLADAILLYGTEDMVSGLECSSSPPPPLENVLSDAASPGTQILKLGTNEQPSDEAPFSSVALRSLLEQRNANPEAKAVSSPSSATTTASRSLGAGPLGGGMTMNINGGFNGGISSGFLNSSLVAHDSRYAAHCTVAVGPPLTPARAAKLRAWVTALVSAKGAPEGSALRVKAVVFLAHSNDHVKSNSACSNSSNASTFDPWALPRAAAVLEASATGGLRWEEIPLHYHDHHPHHHHDEPADEEHGMKTLSSSSSSSSSRDAPPMHCLDMSCPLNDAILNGPNLSHPTQAVSGDFSPSEAANSLSAQRSNLVKGAMSRAVEEAETEEVSPWRRHRSSRGKREGAEKEAGDYCGAALGSECKLFVLCRGGGSNSLKASLLGPKLRSLLVPPGFGWAADEEIDFPAEHYTSLSSRHRRSGAATTIDDHQAGSTVAPAAAEDEARVVHAVVRASSVDDNEEIGNYDATCPHQSQASSSSVAIALTRHGPRRVVGPSKSCYPAGQTLKASPNAQPPPPEEAATSLEAPIDEPPLPEHYYSATSSNSGEGEEGRRRAPRRQHRVLKLFDGDLFVEMEPIAAR